MSPTWLLSFRDMSRQRGGPVRPGALYRIEGEGAAARFVFDPDDIHWLRARLREHRAVFITHGYNVPRDSGVAALRAAAQALSERKDYENAQVIAVIWPGDADIGGPGGAIWRGAAYPFVGGAADKSARELALWVDANIPAPARLSFVSHSLGARLALGAPGQTGAPRYSFTGAASPPQIEQICVMAAAVRNNALEESRFLPSARLAARVSVLSSGHDRVLKYAFPLGDPLQSLINWSGYSPRAALGLTGPRFGARAPDWLSAKATAHRVADADKADHGDYLPEGGGWNNKQKQAIQYAGDAVAGKPLAWPP
ncbi:MAG: hypothetical protein KIS81_08575 [Maricaulaceae bacterium]|nr:hypothetical protein [Maricaulaceae bacterium]